MEKNFLEQSNEKENEGEWQKPREEIKKKKQKIRRELGKTDIMTDQEANSIFNVFDLELKARWKLYRYPCWILFVYMYI